MHCPLVEIDNEPESVTEGTPVVFTLTADPVPQTATTVALAWQYDADRILAGPEATVGQRPPETITFDAGVGTASITILTINNLIADGDTCLKVRVVRDAASASNPYGLGTSPHGKVCIEDDDE